MSRLTHVSLVLVACGGGAPAADEPAADASSAEAEAPAEAEAEEETAAEAEAEEPAAEAEAEGEADGSSLIGEIEGPEIITDESAFPTELAEAPMLAEMVGLPWSSRWTEWSSCGWWRSLRLLGRRELPRCGAKLSQKLGS